MTIRRTLASLAVSAVAAVTLAACSEGDTAEFDSPAPQQASTAAGDAAAVPDEPATAAPSADSPAVPADTTPVGPEVAIETITYDMPGADPREEATVTVGLHSLRHEGDVLALELSFTPDFKGDGEYDLYQMHGTRIMPVLNDRANLKQYTVLGSGGGGGGWQTDTGPVTQSARSGQTLMYWGYFAAPEDDIDTIAVGVGQVEFTDVTIER